MFMLTPAEVARRTGLTYARALLVIKAANHLQINNRYYIEEEALMEILRPSEPLVIQSEEEEK